jgi:L-seryl-tRNA(Ser) seleniumtransferase
MAKSLFERIPSVHELLEAPALRNLVDRVSHHVVVTEVRSFLDNLRTEIQSRTEDFQIPSAGELADRIADWIKKSEQPRLRPVINATGILLHTGLGRAPLAKAAIDALANQTGDYISVELDLESGERGQRLKAVERLLCELTGADRALVVNNCAAATLLTLAALAQGKEVIVSRGELIEIGGSYRLPDVMSASGAILREVGTTNRTRLADYEQACRPATGALLKAHTSNYRIVGFHEDVSLSQLVSLGRTARLHVIYDLGSGALVDLTSLGIRDEPTVRSGVMAGADVVLFSGDKLLGGPQCGILVCRRESYDLLNRHPLMRACRVDKMTLIALSATLQLYRNPETALAEIPVLSLLSTSIDNLKNRAERLAPQIAACPAVDQAHVAEGVSQLGGGTTPDRAIPTWCICIQPKQRTVDQLAKSLRMATPSIVGRIQNERFWLDLRTVFPRQDQVLVEAFQRLGAAVA